MAKNAMLSSPFAGATADEQIELLELSKQQAIDSLTNMARSARLRALHYAFDSGYTLSSKEKSDGYICEVMNVVALRMAIKLLKGC